MSDHEDLVNLLQQSSPDSPPGTSFLLDNYRIALDSHAIVAITDLQGQIVYVNDRFCQLSGYSKDELLGESHGIVNSNFHPKAFFQELWQTISAGESWSGVIRNRTKTGGYYWVKTSIFPFRSPSGKAVGYISVRTDITEQIEAMTQLDQVRRELEHDREALQRKNAALAELLNYLDDEKNKIIETMKANFEIAVFPMIDQLIAADPAKRRYYEHIRRNLHQIADPTLQKVQSTSSKLTPKELQVCSMIRQGLTVKEIAQLLHLSPRTVDKHRENIRKKLGITDRRINLGSYLLRA